MMFDLTRGIDKHKRQKFFGTFEEDEVGGNECQGFTLAILSTSKIL